MKYSCSGIFKRKTPGSQDESCKEQPAAAYLPRHIAIIMDGNGRWARARMLPRAAGHRAGVETLKKIIETVIEIGIPYLTVFAFSTENWKRPRDEVDMLMNLLVEYVDWELQSLHENGVRIRTLGDIGKLPDIAQQRITRAVKQTANNTKLNFQIALNYGSRAEIVNAVRTIARDICSGKLEIEDINEELFSEYLFTAGIPDPDLLIRPSGELRVSNFMLWQSAYTELWFADICWPDFKPADLYRAIGDYRKRHRRYGGI